MGLLLHGVPDSPPLTGTRLQHQQVAEVNIGRHNLQTAPAGSINNGLVLQGRDEKKRQSVDKAEMLSHISVGLWTGIKKNTLLQVV